MVTSEIHPRRPRYGFLLALEDGTLLDVPRKVTRPRTGRSLEVMTFEVFSPETTTFPVLAQPKYDGVRATLSRDGLYTRDRLRILSLPQIEALGAALPAGVVVDGELWGEGLTLEEISATIRCAEPAPLSSAIALHAFDLFLEGERASFGFVDIDADAPFAERHGFLANMIRAMRLDVMARLRVVETVEVRDAAHLAALYERWIDLGHEGQIVRAPDGAYVHGRTGLVRKRKPFRDAEGELIAIVNGRKTGLPRTAIVRDPETGEKITVAIQAMTDDERRRLAAAPPPAGSLVGYRWQPTRSTHRRHCTFTRFYGPAGRL